MFLTKDVQAKRSAIPEEDQTMIVSYRHRFVFLHLGRTGGRSLTAALAKHCGPDDIITPVEGFPGQNYSGFGRHDSAVMIRRKVGTDVWNEFFKFTFERNPWDKILSRYWDYAGVTEKKAYKKVYEKIVGRPLGFKSWFRMKVWQGRWLGLGHIRFPRHYDWYMENQRLGVDFVGRFEHRKSHLAVLSQQLGLPIDMSIRIGYGARKVRACYTTQYDLPMRRIVESVFRKDLDLLGYAFGEPAPDDILRPGQPSAQRRAA